MTESEIWNAFGSDSSSDDDDGSINNVNNNKDYDDVANDSSSPGRSSCAQQHLCRDDADDDDDFVPSLVAATDAALLHITSHFLRLSSLSGVPFQDRVVGIGVDVDNVDSSAGLSRRDVGDAKRNDELTNRKYHEMVAVRVRGRGMTAFDPEDHESCCCDAAIILRNERSNGRKEAISCIKRNLLPGGSLWMIIAFDGEGDNKTTDNDTRIIDDWIQANLIQEFPISIWSMEPSSSSTTTTIMDYSKSSSCRVVHLRKHACVINEWSCPWMSKSHLPLNRRLVSTYNETEEYFPIITCESESESENYLQYERRVASAVTIVPSVKERRCHRCHCGTTTSGLDQLHCVTLLTEEHIQRASELLQKHGLVIVKGLVSPHQTVQWGKAVLSDFQSAVSRLKCHPTRPVDLLNPQSTSGSDSGNNVVFEPLSYKEMAMREDLRVDLRSGPEMETLRKDENDLAVCSMTKNPPSSATTPQGLGANTSPTMIHADVMGTVDSWRFHPSILAIIKRVFNPRKESFSGGNFGRWNFGGMGPDGTPQPFRLGQIGSVISCPGSADQAIHADTPHLFEHEDCLPCHYLNVFTPGYQVVNDAQNDCVELEFTEDGVWTGNSTMGGTAFVYGSHKLSVSAQLLSEEEDCAGRNDPKMGSIGTASFASASLRKKMLWLRTLRPSLVAGDVLIFDCRTIHFGLANYSRGDQSGFNANAGRRPMLYANVTQAWFHDPKNWDDREEIFD